MKTLLILFVLLFSSSVVAASISDFRIGGISVGDNLLDHYSQKEIDNSYTYKYKNDKFMYHILDDKYDQKYDHLQITVKSPSEYISSNKLEIHSIGGGIDYKNNVEDCYPKQKIIKKDLDSFFGIDGIYNSGKHPLDETNKSKWNRVDYFLNVNDDYSSIRITCYDLSEKMEDQGYRDHLQVIVSTKEFLKFINEENWK